MHMIAKHFVLNVDNLLDRGILYCMCHKCNMLKMWPWYVRLSATVVECSSKMLLVEMTHSEEARNVKKDFFLSSALTLADNQPKV